jgi:hypothetical protein
MPNEPINLFSARGDPEQVRNLMLTWFPAAEVDGESDSDWSAITATFDGGKRLTLLHDRDYYTGPGWAKQKAGMQGYFDRFPLGDRRDRLMSTIGTFQFSLATRFDPDYDPAGDERLAMLCALTETVDGVLFSPSALRDAKGRILVSADGEVDADAEWPTVGLLAQAEHLDEAPAVADDDWQPDPPSAERVASRAVALMLFTARAVLERDFGKSDAIPANYDRLREWIDELGIADEFEPWERAALNTRPGELDRQVALNAMWRVEGLEVLAWALGLKELPRYDQMSDVDGVFAAVRLFRTPTATAVLNRPALRPAEELDAFRKQMLGYHWRLRDFRWREPVRMDFRAFAANCWFGSFDVSAFDLIDDELALQGQRLDEADDGVFGLCSSIVAERHLAANWLCWGPAVYSDTDVST